MFAMYGHAGETRGDPYTIRRTPKGRPRGDSIAASAFALQSAKAGSHGVGGLGRVAAVWVGGAAGRRAIMKILSQIAGLGYMLFKRRLPPDW
jgi:hypothetical protein